MKIKIIMSFMCTIILLGGCFVNSQKFDDATIMKAKKSVESYIRNNYNDIHKVEFDNDYSHPMGGIMIKGIVNEKAGFTADVDPDDLQIISLGKKQVFRRGKTNVRKGPVTIKNISFPLFAKRYGHAGFVVDVDPDDYTVRGIGKKIFVKEELSVKKRYVISRKKLGILSSMVVVLTGILLLTGCVANQKHTDYDSNVIKKAEESVESFIRNNYEGVKTVKFGNDYSHPMGGMMIRGTVNGNADFSADIDTETFEVMSVGEKKGFPKVKKECEKKICDY
ncbi:DUF1433 domain-containing protein [Virgibacillus sp. 179-BFC.A HS]|uniref:DUF1433 domain-containing protein n=1 Tax=Tigheibacillus jepli TaxID=3035914 RepID=A0ABU5CDJ3_9BACI|nr:DUF1433 domain-containing protein [Virgibacillus sp. 179-BFC.A HS]MDY0404066.1 DUF1433 domain-containing protein [Virgibacillus sp. 179-BFC.A HS]